MANDDISNRDLRQAVEHIVQPSNVASGSQVLSNGQDIVFNITTTNNAGARTLAEVDFSLYVGSVLAANQLPGGANVTASQWLIMGPWHDLAATDNNNTVTKVYVRNVSAGASQTVLIQAVSRVIANSISNLTA